MYRLLIVDDEPDIAEGLYNFFYNYEALELDVFKAYSAYEAIKILDSERIDIVVSDVCMPGMDGLEMVSQVKKRWPYCQVIFLSGYTEFEYIYRANKLEAVNFILKTEGYEAIANSLHKAIKRIQDEARLSRIHENKLEFKHEFVSYILQNINIAKEELRNISSDMNIALDPEKPVFFLVGLFKDMDKRDIRDKAKVYPVLNELCCRYIIPRFNLILDEYEKNNHIFIIQPKDNKSIIQPKDDKSMIQSRDNKSIIQSPNNKPAEFPEENRTGYIAEIKGLVEMMQNAFLDELSVNVSFVILDEPIYLNELGSCYKNMKSLLNDGEEAGMELIIVNQDMISSLIKDGKRYSLGDTQAISIVKNYIAENLDKPLSLTLLANLVYYNSSYLSRIFKKFTGMTLTNYITKMRMEKAKEMLTRTNKKINAIASELCFASQSYFNQAFRRETGMSPLEYRIKYRRML